MWRQAGGQRFDYIPALNADDAHVAALSEVAAREMGGWPENLANYSEGRAVHSARRRAERARNLGANQ